MIENINLFDDGQHDDGAAGDGVFGGNTNDLNTSGRYVVFFQAQGSYNGQRFIRQAADRIDVLPTTRLFTGSFNDSATDTNSDGALDAIQETVGVRLFSSGSYLVSAELYDAQGYFVSRAVTGLAAGSAGTYSVNLVFDVTGLNCSQYNNNFALKNLLLMNGSSFNVLDRWDALVSTRTYSGAAFGCSSANVAPQITNLQPSVLLPGDSNRITITGRSFINGARASLGNGITVSSVSFGASDTLFVDVSVSPGAAVGSRDVAVTNPDGRSITASGLFSIGVDQPPAVFISYPTDQQVLLGTITASASVADDRGVQKVEFYLDSNLSATDTAFPYQFVLDTTRIPAGSHILLVKAYDTANQSGAAQIRFYVGNSATSVSAASYDGLNLAPESIAAAFGTALSTSVQAAASIPLPTSLAGTTVKIKDSAGTERIAPLFFVAPTQVNYQIPQGTVNGLATITIMSGNGSVSIGTAQIASAAPGLFSANANGQGVAAAVVLRVRGNGTQSFEPVTRFDSAQNRFVSVPIDLGPSTDQVFLILYGTGARFRSSLSAVSPRIGGVESEVLFAGASPGFVGLDQFNIRIPRSLAGRGEVDVTMIVDGKVANTVRVAFR